MRLMEANFLVGDDICACGAEGPAHDSGPRARTRTVINPTLPKALQITGAGVTGQLSVPLTVVD